MPTPLYEIEGDNAIFLTSRVQTAQQRGSGFTLFGIGLRRLDRQEDVEPRFFFMASYVAREEPGEVVRRYMQAQNSPITSKLNFSASCMQMFTSQHDYPSDSSCIGISLPLQAHLVLDKGFLVFFLCKVSRRHWAKWAKLVRAAFILLIHADGPN